MTSFRHLDYAEDATVDELGPAALDDLLDRGDLEDWTPLLRRVAGDPDGPLADRILALCEANPRYGTSELWRAWIGRRRRDAPREQDAEGLSALRRRRGLTQVELAARLGISQSDVSKLERRPDLLLSTLARYVAATGARLRIHAEYPDGPVEVRTTKCSRSSCRA
jgi:DNA-binding XRE family transcriptional regulator